ncbi:integral membrane protein [Fusarium beomiforme]|uniref:Integral membrane protein n=1 Tax=Fusarium beomiforme TaxID=44412 RepID=A0A9P5DYI9_9HYPO|nr:integral membrane protein [Fusarium beomiforme]
MSQDVGAMPPPVGVTPNFDGISALQKTVVIVFSCTFFIATVIFALRMYCAVVLVRKLDWDIRKSSGIADFYRGTDSWLTALIILAWGGSLGFFIIVILAIPFGFGKHLWDVILSNIPTYMDASLPFGKYSPLSTDRSLQAHFRSFVVVISCIRFGYVQVMNENPDDTWIQAQTSLWSCIEMNTAIICNCLTNLAPFVRRHLPRFKRFVSRGTSRNRELTDEGSNCQAHRQWVGEGIGYDYELHSVERCQQPPPVDLEGNIVVVEELSVDFTPAKKDADGSSTEVILRH